jgi:hypothetical protein
MSIDMTVITCCCPLMSGLKKEGNEENILPLMGKTIPHKRISGNIRTFKTMENFGPGSNASKLLLILLILFAGDAFGSYGSGF